MIRLPFSSIHCPDWLLGVEELPLSPTWFPVALFIKIGTIMGRGLSKRLVSARTIVVAESSHGHSMFWRRFILCPATVRGYIGAITQRMMVQEGHKKQQAGATAPAYRPAVWESLRSSYPVGLVRHCLNPVWETCSLPVCLVLVVGGVLFLFQYQLRIFKHHLKGENHQMKSAAFQSLVGCKAGANHAGYYNCRNLSSFYRHRQRSYWGCVYGIFIGFVVYRS